MMQWKVLTTRNDRPQGDRMVGALAQLVGDELPTAETTLLSRDYRGMALDSAALVDRTVLVNSLERLCFGP